MFGKTDEGRMKGKTTIVGFIVLISVLADAALADLNVTYTIDTRLDRAPISPYIYGANPQMSGSENLAARRVGGNRLTGYNWENNYSHAGEDWYNYNDNYLVASLPSSQRLIPGIFLTNFHDSCLAANQLSLITLQMAGYVSADGNGTVTEAQTAPSSRWKQVVYAKGALFCNPPGSPNITDPNVYMDECVNFLVSRYGNASTATGVKCYSLDNEPALWPETHPRIHPNKTGCQELITRTVALSLAIKNVDPYAQIFGPVLYGFTAYYSLQDAPDWSSVKNGYSWFIDYYLDKMRQAEITYGRRLLDVLDLHWYPEAQGDGQRIVFSSPPYSQANSEARMQAPRSLWDYDYHENSWIEQWFGQYLPLLPRVQNSINTYYPGTKLAITEYSYGAEEHFSGGIAMADVLGIFGKYGLYFASYWQTSSNYSYVTAAYKIYRNYDGFNSTFGDTKVFASTSDKQNSSVYASVFDGNQCQLHLVVINKNFDYSIGGTFNITSPRTFTSARVWAFNASAPTITELTAVPTIAGNSFSYVIPPLTVCHIVLGAEQPLGDLDGNCAVDLRDVGVLAEQWLTAGDCPGPNCADLVADNNVDFADLAALALSWGL
jgi:hypothetical protein